MEYQSLGNLWPVSKLALGGGGLGQVWGKTDRKEAVATVIQAVESGINLLDMAPGYGRGEAETVIGEAFAGNLPADVHITTKVQIGSPPAEEIEDTIRRRLQRSLTALKLDRVDLYFLHSMIIPDAYVFPHDADIQHKFATRWSLYTKHVIPVFEKLKQEGLIGAWGISGIGLPERILKALDYTVKPAAVQCISNCMDSAGAIQRFVEPLQPRNIISVAAQNSVGVMGIRAVQAGALTDAMDREMAEDNPDFKDYLSATPFRELAKQLGHSAALLAHAYAISMQNVDTVVLGVKNRRELSECLGAEKMAPLPGKIIEQIDQLF